MERSIREGFICYAAEEGSQTALDELQRIQSSLETLMETGSPTEVQFAAYLITRVNDTIAEIVRIRAAA